ncbi:hypothetical protein AB0D58_30800 [Streptomyces sp. NPDC048210]|uniref:hypothetical protein n=1 Tax=Streptomyces TaxID=1883 RepID=UPI0011B5884A|nr:hypothetical protein [Streptomyces sp. FT05W]
MSTTKLRPPKGFNEEVDKRMGPWSLTAAVAIIAIVSAVVVYAIKHLSSTPVRVAAVIVAIATLVGVFPRVIDSLRTDPVPAEAPPTSPQEAPPASARQAVAEHVPKAILVVTTAKTVVN